MEKDFELYQKKLERVFHELGENIFSFFDFHSLMLSLTVSRDFYHLLNQYFKSFLVKNNLIEGKPKSATEEEDYYLRLFRSFYSRETLVGQLSSIKQSCEELQLVRYPRCSTYGVKDFSIGTKFTVFHLYNNDIIFLKSEEYLNPLFNMKNINLKNIRKNVVKFSTKAKDLLYMTYSGHLHVVFHSTELASHLFSEGTLQLTEAQPLKDFEASYSQALLLVKGSQGGSQKKSQKKEEYKEEKGEKTNCQDIRYLSLQNLTIEDLNAPERVKKVEGLDDQEIASICVGSNTAYLIGDNWRVFECDLSVMNNDKYVIFPYEGLKSRVIRKLWCGHSFYFALEQNEIASIEDWSQEEILKWVSSWKDFEEFVNIIKYENISGKELLQADKEFLVDRLGMMREDLQVKFLNEIDKVSKKTFKKPKLYGWGKNDFGQLGLNASNVIVNHPHGVALPELEKGDQIKHVECGWRTTAIITQEGRVWMTEVPTKKVPPKEKEVEELPEKKEKGKKKKKESVDIPEEKKVEKPVTPWVDLSAICGTLKDGRKYKIIKVSLSKDHFAVLGANLGQKLSQKGEEKGGKFKGADHIFKRIMWDEKFKIEEFVVGYEDRFLGILEIPFAEFSLKTDIPLHRIKFFKRNGEVVWDRAAKVTSL